MKYKSLRFFIGINELLAWGVFIAGGLFALIAGTFFGKTGDGAMGIVIFLGIGAFTAVQGLLIFALGNLFECFIDIEENTRRTVLQLGNRKESDQGEVRKSEIATESTPSSRFSFMCPTCHTFLYSDVLSCSTCGADNPHHPSNKAKIEASKAEAARKAAANTCMGCGAKMNQTDKFCTECGHARL